MSERVTWTSCPRCGEQAAVGWQTRGRSDGSAREEAVEFDCPAGCCLTDLPITYWFHPGDKQSGPPWHGSGPSR